MKTRIGFISNSSSSSFIIVIDPPTKCKHCGRSDLDILDILDLIEQGQNNDCETSIDAEGKKEIIKYINDTWFIGDGKEILDITNKINEVDSKSKVALVSVSYSNDILNNLINNSKNIKILYKDN